MAEQEEYRVVKEPPPPEPSKVAAVLSLLRARVRSIIAFLILVWSGCYLWAVTFTKSAELNSDAKLIVGFVIGTGVGTLINFYFGGSEKKDTPDEPQGPGPFPLPPVPMPDTDIPDYHK